MIILEGPDGAGKTSLMSTLLDRFPNIEEHARASTSKGGPVDNIFDWAHNDVMSWEQQRLSFYDRHPMISEPIYGPIVRDYVDPRFASFEGEDLGLRMLFDSLIIICLPSLEEVVANVTGNEQDQMSGVADNIGQIYAKYQLLLTALRGRRNVFWYDYNRPLDLTQLMYVIEAHQIMWNKNRGNHG